MAPGLAPGVAQQASRPFVGAGSPAILAGEAVGVRVAQDGGRDCRIGPARKVGDVLGIDREARRESEAVRLGRRS